MSDINDVTLHLNSAVAVLKTRLDTANERVTALVKEIESLEARVSKLERAQMKNEAIKGSKISPLEVVRKNWIMMTAIIGWIATAGYTIEIAKEVPVKHTDISVKKTA